MELPHPSTDFYANLIRAVQEINGLNDLDATLDKVLQEARQMTLAEAGSIFLREGSRLRFAYVQNEVLFQESAINKAVYEDITLPIDDHSLVGYCALTGENINLEDAYQLPDGAPYGFNREFDQKTGYRTRSILSIPLKSHRQEVIGVLQLINARSPDKRQVLPFTPTLESLLPLFTIHAATALEQGLLTRELILRMMHMAELRDPTETGAHVQRVGAYSAEIYHQWAMDHQIPISERKRQKSLIRIASMLHDVGKVGISDLILKKAAKLTEEEFLVMKWHTVFGARLFAHSTSDLDRMAMEIALNHHEKWDGSGYPGAIADIHALEATLGPSKRGEEIPLAARITALADVFDALCSKRVYKEAWSDEKILQHIEASSGNHFDPEVVASFMAIIDVIKAIRARFQDPSGSYRQSLEGMLV